MGTKISELTAAGALAGTESIPAVQSGTTKKTTAQDIANLATGGTFAAFASYTPSNTNITVGNGTQTATWSQLGKLVVARYTLVWGSTTSFGGVIRIGLPTAAKASTTYVGAAYMLDNTTQHYSAVCLVGVTDATSMHVHHSSAVGSGDTSATSPFTWTTNDKLHAEIVYEAA